MADVLWNHVAVTATTSQLVSRWYSFRKSCCGWIAGNWSYGQSLDFALAITPKRRRLVDGSLKAESFESITPRMCFRDVGNSPSGLNDEGMCRNGEDGLMGRMQEISCDEQKPEFLRNFLIDNGSEANLMGENDSYRTSGEVYDKNENRIHYLEERNEEILSKRLLKLSRLNKVTSAVELFDSMKHMGLRPSTHACNSLLSCLLRSRNLYKAFDVFEFMWTKESATGHTYSLLLKAVAETKGCDSAIEVFSRLEKDPKHKMYFDVIMYNTVISICGRKNNSLEAKRIWTIMKEDDLIGTEISYSLLVSIFARCGRNDLALDAYDEMIENKITPRADAMHAMISVCGKEDKWELALEIFQTMLNKRIEPNLVACNTLINLLGKARKIELVFKVYEIAKSLGYVADEYTWNALLTALYRENRYEDVLQLFNTIRSERLSKPNEHLYNTALMSCQKLGSWETGLKLLYEMEGLGLSVSTSSYNMVICACETSRLPKIALQVYRHMVHKKCEPDTFTHLSLIRSCIWGSMWDDVEDILQRVDPDVSLYNAAVHGMCLRGEIKLAKKMYMRMRDIGLIPDGKTRAMMLQNLKKESRQSIRSLYPRRKGTISL